MYKCPYGCRNHDINALKKWYKVTKLIPFTFKFPNSRNKKSNIVPTDKKKVKKSSKLQQNNGVKYSINIITYYVGD